MRRSSSRNTDSGPHRLRIRNPMAHFPSKPAATPSLPWKSLPAPDPPRDSLSDSGEKTQIGKRNVGRVSARRFAAGMWRSEFQEIEPGLVHLHPPPNGLKHCSEPKIRTSCKLRSSAVVPNPILERATKWDAECSKPLEEVYRSFDHLKLLMDQQIIKASTIEAKLKVELNWARDRIVELEAKRHLEKKKLKDFLKKHAEEKALWRTREHENIRAVIDGMRGDLSIERKYQRQTEVLNAKLIDELALVKKSTKRFMKEYKKEKKARELFEEVCNELAKEVGEDRVEVGEVKMESMRVREELEEERKMLQMAEVWREERVQMKLIDAKQALEDQCVELKSLAMELEAFLRSRDGTNADSAEIREAELLIEAVAEAVKMRDMKTFTYQPPLASEDIYAVFEELQQREEPKEREIEPCYGSDTPASGAFGIHSASPATDIFLGKPMNGSVDEDSEWETLSNGDVDSSYFREVNGENNCKLNERKNSYISKPWRSPFPDNGENYEKTIANGSLSKGGLSDVEFRLTNLEQWSSSDARKPQGACKQSLKAKLLKSRLENHNVPIRHVLKAETFAASDS